MIKKIVLRSFFFNDIFTDIFFIRKIYTFFYFIMNGKIYWNTRSRLPDEH